MPILLPRVARIRIAAYAGPLARLPLSAPDMPFRWSQADRAICCNRTMMRRATYTRRTKDLRERPSFRAG
jgi:hypothetical protein